MGPVGSGARVQGQVDADAFWANVSPCPLTGCYWWVGPGSESYGVCKLKDGTRKPAHWGALALAGRPLPRSRREVVGHRCDMKPCVREDHLETVSNSQNVRDAWARLPRRPKMPKAYYRAQAAAARAEFEAEFGPILFGEQE